MWMNIYQRFMTDALRVEIAYSVCATIYLSLKVRIISPQCNQPLLIIKVQAQSSYVQSFKATNFEIK